MSHREKQPQSSQNETDNLTNFSLLRFFRPAAKKAAPLLIPATALAIQAGCASKNSVSRLEERLDTQEDINHETDALMVAGMAHLYYNDNHQNSKSQTKLLNLETKTQQILEKRFIRVENNLQTRMTQYVDQALEKLNKNQNEPAVESVNNNKQPTQENNSLNPTTTPQETDLYRFTKDILTEELAFKKEILARLYQAEAQQADLGDVQTHLKNYQNILKLWNMRGSFYRTLWKTRRAKDPCGDKVVILPKQFDTFDSAQELKKLADFKLPKKASLDQVIQETEKNIKYLEEKINQLPKPAAPKPTVAIPAQPKVKPTEAQGGDFNLNVQSHINIINIQPSQPTVKQETIVIAPEEKIDREAFLTGKGLDNGNGWDIGVGEGEFAIAVGLYIEWPEGEQSLGQRTEQYSRKRIHQYRNGPPPTMMPQMVILREGWYGSLDRVRGLKVFDGAVFVYKNIPAAKFNEYFKKIVEETAEEQYEHYNAPKRKFEDVPQWNSTLNGSVQRK